MDANMESFENMKINLKEQSYDLAGIPYVIQYNKRDLPGVAPVAELKKILNVDGAPDFEAVAAAGVGVFETLKAVVKLVLIELKKGT
ncbi:MAG: GTPase domain-containing protein, partial [Deltaproteobacteria bacterium]